MSHVALTYKERRVMQALAEGKDCRDAPSVFPGLTVKDMRLIVEDVVHKVGAQCKVHALALLAYYDRVDGTNLEGSIAKAKKLEFCPTQRLIFTRVGRGDVLTAISHSLHVYPRYARSVCDDLRRVLGLPTIGCLVVVLTLAGHIYPGELREKRLSDDQQLLFHDILLKRTISEISTMRKTNSHLVARNRTALLRFLKAVDWYHGIALAIQYYRLDPPRELWETIRFFRTITIGSSQMDFIYAVARYGEEKGMRLTKRTASIKHILCRLRKKLGIEETINDLGMFAVILWSKNLVSY